MTTIFGPNPLLTATVERSGSADDIHLHTDGQGEMLPEDERARAPMSARLTAAAVLATVLLAARLRALTLRR